MPDDARQLTGMRPVRRLATVALIGVSIVTSIGCQRKPRAREREAAAERAKAEADAREAERRAAEPPPAEPPVELTRVADSGLPCAVDDVFARKCRRCHTIPTRHGAPFVFLTWEDTQQDRGGQKLVQLIGRAVRSDFMPYRIEANPPVEPLTVDEKKTIMDWVDAGGPRGNCVAGAAPDQKTAASSPSGAPQKAAVPKLKAAPAPSNDAAR